MPTISLFYGIFIRMYYNDQAPPHFHSRYGESDATIDTETRQVVKGDLPARALKLVPRMGDHK